MTIERSETQHRAENAEQGDRANSIVAAYFKWFIKSDKKLVEHSAFIWEFQPRVCTPYLDSVSSLEATRQHPSALNKLSLENVHAAIHYYSLYLRSASRITTRCNYTYVLINYYYLTVDARVYARKSQLVWSMLHFVLTRKGIRAKRVRVTKLLRNNIRRRRRGARWSYRYIHVKYCRKIYRHNDIEKSRKHALLLSLLWL